MDGIVIAGAGECGTRAAFALRETGYAGNITLVGAEPQLPYERPPLSKPDSGGPTKLKLICAAEALESAGIDYLQGVSVCSFDPDAKVVELSDGRTLPYEKLLLATGARPRVLDCPGAGSALYFRTHADAQAIFSRAAPGQRVAIIGAGLIGMELAATLCKKGVTVSVVESAPRPFGRAVPFGLAHILHQRHIDEGVIFHLGQSVAAIDDEGVILSDGDRVPADLVVGAIGVLPDIDLAKIAGLETGNGIVTDACLRTSAPDVYAAGDCALVTQSGGEKIRFESWRSARAQAEIAARNMAGASEKFSALPWFWSDQYNLGLQVAGFPLAKHQIVRRALPNGYLEFYLDNGRLVAAAGVAVGNNVAKDIKLAELLIAAGIVVDPLMLADEKCNLKTLLRSTQAA